MKNKKITLGAIILLLVIFLPITIFSTIIHFKNEMRNENANHEFQYEGKLYFYNNNELLGTYECQNIDGYCDYAVSKTSDTYALDEYIPEKTTKIPLISNQYAFLMDEALDNLTNAPVILFDVLNNKVIGTYSEVKNYGIGIEDDLYIVKNSEELWGVLQIKKDVSIKIPFNYDYIGLANKINTDYKLVIADTFAVLKNNNWQLIDANNAEFTGLLNQEIFTYNGEYIVLKNANSMQLIDYEGKNALSGFYKYINFCSKYLATIDNNNIFYLYDLTKKETVSNPHQVTGINEVSLKIENNNIYITIAGNVAEIVAIN